MMVKITLMIDGWKKDIEIPNELFKAGVIEISFFPSIYANDVRVRFYRDYQNCGGVHPIFKANQ